ncbi:MAG: hypothetical protein J2P47_05900 [Acetobacteraceae bacterium]|nr:hypothetical protein [Acetobacteraceae bacterium]
MSIFHLKPIPGRLDDPHWRASPYRGECWVNAASEDEARGLASARYEDARQNIPGVSSGPSPWMEPRLVAAQREAEPSDGTDIPSGVVLRDSYSGGLP